MTANKKLLLGGIVVVGVTAYMAYLGAASGWQYYVTADECQAGLTALQGKRLRVSGKVAAGSLKVAADRQQAAFILAGTTARLGVDCTGPLPDHFAEGVDVLVEGALEASGRLRGENVITRCASKYSAQLPANPVAGPPAINKRSPRPLAGEGQGVRATGIETAIKPEPSP
jgi:cytochrome c-type biogenesis protein CcmE